MARFLISVSCVVACLLWITPVVAEEASTTEVKEGGAKAGDTGKAQPAKLEPVKAGPVFSSLESNDVSRAKIYPTVANFSSRYTQQIEFPEDPPPGLKIGNTTLFPTWLETLTFEDNIYGTSRKKQADLGLFSQGGFGVSHRFNEDIQMGANYKLGWYDYLDNKAKDYMTENVDFTLNMSNIGVQGLSLNVYDSYAQTGNPGSLNESYAAFVRQHQNSSGAMVSYELERITATASYDYNIVDEFGRNGFDYQYHKVNGMFAYKVNRRVRPYLKYGFYSYDFADTDTYNYTVHELTGGVIWRPYDKFEFDWYVGNRRALSVSDDNSDDGPIVGMNLTYHHNEKYMAYFRSSYQYEVGVLTGGAHVTSAEAGTMCRIWRELSVGGKASWVREDRMSGEDLRTTQAGCMIRYQYQRQFFFFGEYNWTGQESNLDGYKNWNKATVGFQWRY